MNRTDFIKTAFRYLLFGLLAFIAIVAGRKAVPASDCSSCPGKGICKGEIDCEKYLPVRNGKG
ncbi:MAG: hypothetical protein ABR974_01880 [Bacteroidales bacterium]|jgi:hypothetical protein